MSSVIFGTKSEVVGYNQRGTTAIYEQRTDYVLNTNNDPRDQSHSTRMLRNLEHNILAIDPRPSFTYQTRGETFFYFGGDRGKYNRALQAWNARRQSRETAQRFAIDLYRANKEDFYGARANLEAVYINFGKKFPAQFERFKAKYSDEDLSQIRKAITAATDSLEFTARITTPAPKGKLFGFLPIKVKQGVQQFVATSLAAVTAGIGVYVSGAQAGAVGGTQAGTVAGTTVTTVEAGAFSANLGIRGVQAANLASAGGYPGAALGFSAPSLSGGSFAITAAPLTAVSPQALRLGITGTTIKSGVMDTLVARATSLIDNVKSYVIENPTQSAIAATGTSLTLKKIAESSDPLAALVNTVAGAVGLPPIIQPPSWYNSSIIFWGESWWWWRY